jgi:hypothetical protein
VGPGGRAWTEAEVNATGSWTQWSLADGGVTHFARVHELYMDVDINDQPIVTGAPTVTNVTNNATPTVSWVYTDADNDPQTHFQVKIFDSTTYGTGNFSPDTSTAAYDSGDMTGQDAQLITTAQLQNGVTYQAYVRAAQDWPGPQGSVWWSAWATSAPFTISFTAPYTPSISSAAVLADANDYRTILGVDAPVNLLTAGSASFEGGVGSWVADANCSISSVATDHLDGVNCMQMSSTAAGNMIARCELDFLGDPVVDVGKTVTVIASFKTAVTSRSCSVGIRWYASDEVTQIGADQFGSTISDTTGAAGTNWTQAVLTTTVPAGAVHAKALARVAATGGAAELHRVDNVSFHAGSVTTWTPGGYVNSAGDLILERGERLQSARGPAENWASMQVWSCATEIRNQGRGFSWNLIDRLDWMWLDKVISAPGATPAGMLRWGPVTATTSGLAFGWWPYFPAKDYAFPIVPGLSHVFSVWAWCDVGTFVITPKLEWKNDDESPNSAVTGSNVTLTTTPQQIVVSGVAPAAPASMARGLITNTNSDNTKHVFFTRCGFGLGTVPVDGKQPMGGPIVWRSIRFPIDEFASFAVGFDSQQHRVYADFEYPAGRPVLYRASIAYSSGVSNVVKSAYSQQAVVYNAPPTQTILRSITNPLLQVAVNRRKSAAFTHVDDAVIFHPLGADGAPVRVRDWVGGEDGQLIIVTSTEAQLARLKSLITSGDVLQVQWAQGGRSYILLTDRTMDETISVDTDWCDADGTQSWIRYAVHTLAYVETVAP